MNEKQCDFMTNEYCTSSRILEKRRQLEEAQDELEAQKDEFTRNLESLRRREEALRQKDLRLQDSLIKFNKFLQENEVKRTRAMKRKADEYKLCESKDMEINKLQSLLDAKDVEENDLAEKLTRNTKYHTYLKSVIDHQAKTASDNYSEIQDILDRYQTLKSTNDDLLRQLQNNTKDHEASRSSYTQFSKKSSNAILNMNNEIAALQKKMELLIVKSNNMESLDYGTSLDATDLIAELSQIFVVVNQILERFECRRSYKGVGAVNLVESNNTFNAVGEGDSLEKKTKQAVIKLDKIAEYMTDYKSIADDWERRCLEKSQK